SKAIFRKSAAADPATRSDARRIDRTAKDRHRRRHLGHDDRAASVSGTQRAASRFDSERIVDRGHGTRRRYLGRAGAGGERNHHGTGTTRPWPCLSAGNSARLRGEGLNATRCNASQRWPARLTSAHPHALHCDEINISATSAHGRAPGVHWNTMERTMPHVLVKLYSGRSEQQKATLAEALSKAVVSTLKLDEKSVSVAIEDVAPDNWMREVFKPDILNNPKVYKKPGYGA